MPKKYLKTIDFATLQANVASLPQRAKDGAVAEFVDPVHDRNLGLKAKAPGPPADGGGAVGFPEPA